MALIFPLLSREPGLRKWKMLTLVLASQRVLAMGEFCRHHGLDNAERAIALALPSSCPLPFLSWAGLEPFTFPAAEKPPSKGSFLPLSRVLCQQIPLRTLR